MIFVLAQRRLPFSFCYAGAVKKISEVLSKNQRTLCLFRIIAQQVVKTSFRIDKKGGEKEEEIKAYKR